MEKRQLFILAGIVLAFVIAVSWAARFSQGGKRSQSSSTFFARSGTMRERARMLVSKKKAPPKRKGEVNGRITNGDTISSIRRISPQSDEPRPSEDEQAAQEALNALTPEEGIEKVLASLATLETTAETAELYSALGRLYAQTDPPDIANAQAAFATASNLVRSSEAKHRIACLEAKMLVTQDQPRAALTRIRDTLEFDKTITVARLQLMIMLGKLKHDAGDVEAAEAAYRAIVGQSLDIFEDLGPDSVDVYRQACLNLARLYRKTGHDKKADSLVKTMKQRLKLLELP